MKRALFVFIFFAAISLLSCRKNVSTVNESDGLSLSASVSNSLLLLDKLVDTSQQSGIDYLDKIYNFSTGADTDRQASPIYHSSYTAELPCQYIAGDTDQAGCIFDETDLDGDGTPDIASAARSKLFVDKRTGVVDLAASLQAGVFGTATPPNNTRRTLSFYYRLNDNTQRSLQTVTIQLIYFKRMSDVPATLVNEIAVRRQEYRLLSSLSSTTSTLTSYAITYQPKRPPLIVIVSGL